MKNLIIFVLVIIILGLMGYCNHIREEYQKKEDTLIMRSSNVEIGRIEEKMPIVKDNDENIKISFSAKYMMEALRVLSGLEATISFVGEINPIIVRDADDERVIQLVLPIRTY